jgi:hypothetical protein
MEFHALFGKAILAAEALGSDEIQQKKECVRVTD